MNESINFPNLGITLKHVGKSITLFGFEIAFYGMIVALGMMVGVILACREAKETGQKQDDYIDVAMIAIISAIVGARMYFVVLSWDSFKNDLVSIFNLRGGGLAIYGGVIAAAAAIFIFAKVKKLSFWQMADTACIGLIVGQIIGRWGNFFNREAFGDYTDSVLAMQLPLDAIRRGELTEAILNHIKVVNGVPYIQVHPTFLYEALWNTALLIIITCYKRHKRFQGEVFLLYLLGYGIGRSWIEGLRTDQLLLPGVGLPASQVLAIILVAGSTILIVNKRKRLGYKKISQG